MVEDNVNKRSLGSEIEGHLNNYFRVAKPNIIFIRRSDMEDLNTSDVTENGAAIASMRAFRMPRVVSMGMLGCINIICSVLWI